jgi:hypothetical protein
VEAAFEDIVADRLAGSGGGEPAEQFDVPGVEGAVGLVWVSQSGMGDESISELVTEVFFPYGSAVGRVYIIHSGVSDGEAFDDRTEVVRITQTWLPRLEQILGPAA